MLKGTFGIVLLGASRALGSMVAFERNKIRINARLAYIYFGITVSTRRYVNGTSGSFNYSPSHPLKSQIMAFNTCHIPPPPPPNSNLSKNLAI